MSYNNIFNSIDTKSFAYQKNCLTSPIQSSAIGAILFSALDAFQGVPIQEVIKPQKLGTFTFTVTAYSSYSYVTTVNKRLQQLQLTAKKEDLLSLFVWVFRSE